MTDLSHVRVLVPEDVTDAADLPMGALDSGCNHLKCDIVEAVRGEVPGMRYAAMAELAYQWARLVGVEKPKRETYRDYRIDEIAHALGMDREPDEDPTPPAESKSDDSSTGSSESSSPNASDASQATSTA